MKSCYSDEAFQWWPKIIIDVSNSLHMHTQFSMKKNMLVTPIDIICISAVPYVIEMDAIHRYNHRLPFTQTKQQ